MNTQKDLMRKPTIVIPYPGPCSDENMSDENMKDVFVYLRPETNGVDVESILLGVIQKDPQFRAQTRLSYLANLPGDFVTRNKIIERHYKTKCQFAAGGKESFSPVMIRKFETWYGLRWQEADVFGSFEALERFGFSPDDLFDIWIPQKDFFCINGQTVKKVNDHFIINYDIPALLEKNDKDTDIAVMVFRTSLSYEMIRSMIRAMEQALIAGGIMDEDSPPSRYFHYSKSPMEEILDGMGYMYDSNGQSIPLKDISFASYLMKEGICEEDIRALIQNPIIPVTIDGEDDEIYIFGYVLGDSYSTARKKIADILKRRSEDEKDFNH